MNAHARSIGKKAGSATISPAQLSARFKPSRESVCSTLHMPRSEAKSDDRVFHVAAASDNQTVATILRRELANHSWSRIRKLIDSRSVTVNGNLCVDASRRVK